MRGAVHASDQYRTTGRHHRRPHHQPAAAAATAAPTIPGIAPFPDR